MWVIRCCGVCSVEEAGFFFDANAVLVDTLGNGEGMWYESD